MNNHTFMISVYGSTGYLISREVRKLASYKDAETVGREGVRWLGGDHYEIIQIT